MHSWSKLQRYAAQVAYALEEAQLAALNEAQARHEPSVNLDLLVVVPPSMAVWMAHEHIDWLVGRWGIANTKHSRQGVYDWIDDVIPLCRMGADEPRDNI